MSPSLLIAPSDRLVLHPELHPQPQEMQPPFRSEAFAEDLPCMPPPAPPRGRLAAWLRRLSPGRRR